WEWNRRDSKPPACCLPRRCAPVAPRPPFLPSPLYLPGSLPESFSFPAIFAGVFRLLLGARRGELPLTRGCGPSRCPCAMLLYSAALIARFTHIDRLPCGKVATQAKIHCSASA